MSRASQDFTRALSKLVQVARMPTAQENGELKDAREALEEAFEAELDRSYKLGVSSGLGEAATYLKREAGDNFAEGADKEAHWARGKAKYFEECAKKAHPGERTS